VITDELVAEIRRAAAEQGVDVETLLVELRQIAFAQDNHGEGRLPEIEQVFLAELPFEAASAPGIAQEMLIRLLSRDHKLLRFFSDLAHRSGAIPRNVLRLERAPSERQIYREIGMLQRHDARVREAIRPWMIDPSSDLEERGIPNAEIGEQIAAFLERRSLPWPWLARATFGAFTWYVHDVATAIIQAGGDPYRPDDVPTEPPPVPADLSILPVWMWNSSDRPRVPENKVFTAIHLFRGDTIEDARARVHSYVEAVERYLESIAQPAIPPGAKPDKRRETITRNVMWFYKRRVEGKSVASIARAEFARTESNARVRTAIVASRSKDVRDGITAAERLLATRPFDQPILTLDEYEAGRMRI
jgi:hypothetical protein